MRRIFASALVLLPVLASAQVPSAANSMLALLHLPHGLLAAPTGAMGAAPARAVIDPNNLMVPVIQTVVKQSAVADSVAEASSLSAAPKLLHSTPMQLSLADMRAEADHALVVVHFTVNAAGKPINLTIVRSGGAAIDRRALESVQQYEFAPARQNGVPVAAPVTVSIDLKKS